MTKLRNLFIPFIICTLSLTVFAEDPIAITTKSENSVLENSSEFHRAKLKYEISVPVIGYSSNSVYYYGYHFTYYLDPLSALRFGFLNGSRREIASSSFSSSLGDIKSRAIEATYKRFSGNSFYYHGGLNYRRQTYDFYFQSINPAESTTSAYSADVLSLVFSIGNQWQWQNFTLGFDWIGVGLPVMTKFTSEWISLSSATPDIDQAYFDKRKQLYVRDNTYSLLRFYMGWAF